MLLANDTSTDRSQSHRRMSAFAAVSAVSAVSAAAPGSRRPARCHARRAVARAGPPASGAELLATLELEAPGWSGGYGTGGKVWSSSRVLCDYLVDVAAGLEDALQLELRGARVVELGSGTGAVGLACAALGARAVVLTDGGSKSLLRLAETNAARWSKSARAADAAAPDVRVCGYKWGAAPLPSALVEGAPFDLIVGSDCTYSVGGHGALCDAINLLAARGRPEGAAEPAVVLAHQHRTLAAALAGRGSAGWGKDPHLRMFVETAATRGLDVREVRVARLAWHGLRNVSVLRVTRAASGGRGGSGGAFRS